MASTTKKGEKMSITITGKLNKAATQFQAGDSTGFGLNIGVQFYDRETKQKAWTNYKVVVFTNNQAQAGFYAEMLKPSAVVEVAAQTAKISSYESQQNGTVSFIELLDCRLGGIWSMDEQPNQQSNNNNQQQVRQPQQQNQQRNTQQTQQQQQQQPYNNDFDSEIPF